MSIINTQIHALEEESNNWAFRLWEVKKEAEDRLWHSPYLELRNVTCDLHEGVLTLRGRVPSYFLKQLAQTLLSGLDGISVLNNQLDVITSRYGRQSDLISRNNDRLNPNRFL
jgi:hypothetical protein